MFEITNVKVMKFNQNRVKGVAEITIDNCFVVKNIRIIEARDKNYISMPRERIKDGTFKDIAHPINAETRKKIEDAILEKFNSMEDK